MPGPRAVRLPLQIGAQAVSSLAIANATLIPSVIALVATLFVLVVKGGLLVLLFISQGWVIAAIALGLEGWLLYRGVVHLRLALRTRPADVVFDDTGLRIVGGRLHGRRVAWADAKAIREQAPAPGDEVAVTRAVIELAHGELVIAEAADDGELRSLRAVVESVSARLSPSALPPLPPEHHPDLLCCPACGAPAAPVDADHTTCAFCAASVPIGEPLRARLRAIAEVRADSKVSPALLAKLLAQPSARTASIGSVLAGVPITAMWILAVFFGYALYRHHGFRTANVFLLSGAALVAIVAFYYLLRFALVNRMALGVITLEFGAFPPAKSGEPWTCRACSAPLPPARDDLLARCAYCGSDNVQGIDLRPRADGARRERATLERAFAQRSRDRATYAARAAIALVVLPLALWAFFGGAHAVTREARMVVGCDRDDLAACVALGRHYLAAQTYDRDAAMHVLDHACTLGSGDGCVELGRQLIAGAEHVRAGELLWKTCQGGHAKACVVLGELVEVWRPKLDVPAPLVLYQRACAAHDERGCTHVALALADGAGIARDEAGAVRLLDHACTAGDPWACAHLGRMIAAGRGATRDDARAVALFRAACTRKAPEWLACAELANALRAGRGVAKDLVKAFDYTRQACDYGHIGPACTWLGNHQHDRGEDQAAVENLTTACIAGDGPGCTSLATLWNDQGKHDQAIGLLRRSCNDDRVADACALAGVWLATGKYHVRADKTEALKLYDAGCQLASVDACSLGGQLADALTDYATARRLLTITCDRGEPRGCNFLASELEQGQGGPADDAGALALLERSCEMVTTDDARGPQAYGCTHEALLVRRRGDEPRARALFRQACDWKYGIACAWLADAEPDPAAKAALLATACANGDHDACPQ